MQAAGVGTIPHAFLVGREGRIEWTGHPMGIDEDNWPATVGIFTGFFAKEVVVGTLDAHAKVGFPVLF